jgi:serine/threonine protein kinase
MPIDILNCPFCDAKIETRSQAVAKCPVCHKEFHIPLGQKKETGSFKLNEGDDIKPSRSPIPLLSSIQKNLGPYRIERCIGKGGMGFVYEATDTRLNRRVALKTIESGEDVDEHVITRFRREAQSVARLRHPNIVSVHDVGREGGFDYFTMDLVEGITLDKWIQSTKTTLKDRVQILEKVARALHYAHQKGVIHRDVKPGNIMIDISREPQIMDFGLARNARDLTNITLSGSIVGTPAYMAPEQAIGTSSQVGAKLDVWGLGVVLYEVLLDKHPFDNGNVYQTIYAVLHSEPEPPRKIDPLLPIDLETIILKCLEKQVEKRYVSAEALANDLRAWMEGRAIGIRTTPWWEKWMKKLRQKTAISRDEFVLEQEARQRAETQRLELQTKVESETKREWRLLLEENFSDPDIESRWEIIGKRWEIVNGELRLCDGEPQILYLKKAITGDVRIEFECHQDSEYLADVSCFTHALPLKNRKKACETGYMFQYGASENTRSFIEKPGKRFWDKLHSPLKKGERYRVLAEKCGNKLSFWVNDLLICEAEDPEPLSSAERTSLGIYGWIADTRYTFIKIYQLGSPVKGDLLEVAYRQLEKGRYESAIDLFKEVVDSSEDPRRVQQARQGIEISNSKLVLQRNFQRYQQAVSNHWPKAKIELNDKGLILDIKSSNISDLSPVTELPLNELSAGINKIKSLEPLRGMPLSSLYLASNQIESLEPLRGMQLKVLDISKNLISDLEPLAGMKLERLVIGSNPLKSCEAISKMSIDNFSCSSLNLTNLDFVRDMSLSRLICSHNAIADLSPLKGKSLRFLGCSENLIKDLEPIRGMTAHQLNIYRNQIEDLDPLRGTKAVELFCFGNRLKTLEPLFYDPPSVFYFDCDTLSNDELEKAARAWDQQKNCRHHAQNARVIKAVREGDIPTLKGFATKFEEGLHYLFVPKFLGWHEAKTTCEKFGGALLSIENQRELALLKSLWSLHVSVWLGSVSKDSNNNTQFSIWDWHGVVYDTIASHARSFFIVWKS